MKIPVYKEEFKPLEQRVKLLEGVVFDLTNIIEKLQKRRVGKPKKKASRGAS